jgi:cytochrome c-type biogenesis protein CcmF
MTGQSRKDEWILTTRRWTLFAWIFLTIGLILGGRWAYDVLGWGGFWGWDPIENAMLMPWLTGTAFLHSVMMTEKRGMMKKWNMGIILTYALTVFGTFITRTG